MENNSFGNKSKAIALFKWTNRKYLSVSIAYWILLFFAYPLAEIFIMVVSIPSKGEQSYYVSRMQAYGIYIPSTLFAAIAIGYSIVISLIAFSYMHNKRCVDLFGSFPVSRRTLFFSRLASVIFLTIVPVIVIGLIGMTLSFEKSAFIGGAKDIALLCLMLVANICFLAIIALCCGTIIDAMICYGAINLCYPIAVFLCSYYPNAILPGAGDVELPTTVYTLSCPIFAFFASVYGTGLVLHVIWWMGFIIVSVIACYYLSKKRKAETAQNKFAFAIVEIIIKFLTCFTCGLAIGFILAQFGNVYNSILASYIWLVVGIVIGIFASNILLHLAFHRGLSRFKESLIESLVVFVSTGIFIVIISTGGFGYDRRIPKESEIEGVIVQENYRSYFKLGGRDIINTYQSDKNKIKKTLELHNAIIEKVESQKYHGFYPLIRGTGDDYAECEEYDESDYGERTGVIISYKLKNGKKLVRKYESDEVPIEQVKNEKELVANELTMITKIPFKYLSYCDVHDVNTDVIEPIDNKDERKKLISALIKDLSKERKTKKKSKYKYTVELSYTDSGDDVAYSSMSSIYINLYDEYENTMKLLKDVGVLDKLGK